jgi:hypothetical protein
LRKRRAGQHRQCARATRTNLYRKTLFTSLSGFSIPRARPGRRFRHAEITELYLLYHSRFFTHFLSPDLLESIFKRPSKSFFDSGLSPISFQRESMKRKHAPSTR